MTFLVAFVLFIVAGVALGVTVAARGGIRATSRSLPVDVAALLTSLAAILAVTLVPTHEKNELQMVPLVHIIGALTPPIDKEELLLDVVGNGLLFLPLGAMLCLRGFPSRKTVLSGCALSATVEVTQLLVPGRTTSVDDVLLNTLGAALGHALLSRRERPSSPPSGCGAS